MSRRPANNNVLLDFLLPYPKNVLIRCVSPATFAQKLKSKGCFAAPVI